MYSRITRAVLEASDTDEYFSRKSNLSFNKAKKLIDDLGDIGIAYVFRNLDAFKSKDFPKIAEIIVSHFSKSSSGGEQARDVFDWGKRKDSNYPARQDSKYWFLSTFLIQYGYLPELVKSDFEFHRISPQIVNELIAQEQYGRALQQIEYLEPQALLPAAKLLSESGNYRSLMHELKIKGKPFLDKFDPDDLFEVYCLEKHIDSYFQDAFIEQYLIDNSSNFKRFSFDDVAIGIMQNSDGGWESDCIKRGIADHERFLQAIIEHPRVGSILAALDGEIISKQGYNFQIPFYVLLAERMAIPPARLTPEIILAVQNVLDGKDISGLDAATINHDQVKVLLGEENLESISTVIIRQFGDSRAQIDLSQFNREHSLIRVPQLARSLRSEYPFLSDRSIAQLMALSPTSSIENTYLSHMGITEKGEQGPVQLHDFIQHVFRELESGEGFSFPISAAVNDSIICDVVRQYFSERSRRYLYIKSIETGERGVSPDMNAHLTEEFANISRHETSEEILLNIDRAMIQVLDKCSKDDARDTWEIHKMISDTIGLDYRYSVQGRGSIFFPSSQHELSEQFGDLEYDTVLQILRLHYAGAELSNSLNPIMEIQSIERLIEISKDIEQQLLDGQLLEYPFTNPLIRKIVYCKVEEKYTEYVGLERKLRKEDIKKGSPEYLMLLQDLEKAKDNFEKAYGAAILSSIKASVPLKELSRDYTDLFIFDRFIEQGQTYIPPIFYPINEQFSSYPTEIIENLIRVRFMDEIPEMFKELGVTRTGEAGYEQISQQILNMRAKILKGQIPEELKTSQLFQVVFADTIRFGITQFRAEGVIQDWLRHDAEIIGGIGEINPLARDQEPVHTTDQLRKFYNDLVGDFNSACNAVDSDGGISLSSLDGIFLEIESKCKKQIENLEKQKMHLTNKPHKQSEIDEQINKLKEITAESLYDISKFFPRFELLASFKELKHPLRELLLISSVAQNPGLQEVDLQTVNEHESLTIEQASIISDILNHIAYQQTWLEQFEQHAKIAPLKHILQSQDLQSFISSVEKNTTTDGKRVPFTLIPVRGPLLDASGSIADSCWNGRYSSATEEFPNLRAVVIVKNANSPSNSRFAGACLLINAKAEDGADLLVIRGLNPLQSDITDLMQDSFFIEFAQYIDQIAKQEGRKLAVVIDDHAGGSATNRPTLFKYLTGIKGKLEKVELSDEPGTIFNGYNISRHTYLFDLDRLGVQSGYKPKRNTDVRHLCQGTGSFRPSEPLQPASLSRGPNMSHTR